MKAKTTVREKPILMSWAMVRATLAGTKGQTRRVPPIQPDRLPEGGWRVDYQTASKPATYWSEEQLRAEYVPSLTNYARRRYGHEGDYLWVRETWVDHFGQLIYRADCEPGSFHYDATGWRPSIHMPRKLSRITLQITALRVERLHEISEADAQAEGVEPGPCVDGLTYRCGFSILWDKLNADRGYGWGRNPWVIVIDFKRVQP